MKYTICENCKPLYDIDITALSKDIARLKEKLKQVEAILYIYQTYTDQIQFTEEDKKELDSPKLNKII